MLLRLVSFAFFWAALVATTSCNTPQIPLPPPVVGDLSLATRADSLVVLSGSNANMAGGSVTVVNVRTLRGVIAPADDRGSFKTSPFEVENGDELDVSYEVGLRRSESLCVIVADDEQLKPCDG